MEIKVIFQKNSRKSKKSVVELITNLKNNMKNSLMNLYDKILLKNVQLLKLFGKLKQECNLEHSDIVLKEIFCQYLSALAAYQLSTRKPKIKL